MSNDRGTAIVPLGASDVGEIAIEGHYTDSMRVILATRSDADDSISMATEAIYGVNDGERLASGNAVLGTYTRNGTVVTTGCTDWCMGLAGNDPNVCLITRNILDGLSKHCTKKTLS